MRSLLDGPYTSTQTIYDLRRLRLNGPVRRIDGSNQYVLTPEGVRVAAFYPRSTATFSNPSSTQTSHPHRSSYAAPSEPSTAPSTTTSPTPGSDPPREACLRSQQEHNQGAIGTGPCWRCVALAWRTHDRSGHQAVTLRPARASSTSVPNLMAGSAGRESETRMRMSIGSIVGTTLVAGALALGYGCVAPQPPSLAPPGQPGGPPPSPRPPPTGVFVETFDSPAGFYNRFVTQILHGVEPPEIAAWSGDHDVHSAGPTTNRTIHSAVRTESFYWCGPTGPESGHIMTSMNTTGYAQVDFAPNQAFTGISRVCWDVNQTDLGGRKWIQVVIVPEATFQANGGRLDYVTPILQDDVAVGGVRISGETFLLEMFAAQPRPSSARARTTLTSPASPLRTRLDGSERA